MQVDRTQSHVGTLRREPLSPTGPAAPQPADLRRRRTPAPTSGTADRRRRRPQGATAPAAAGEAPTPHRAADPSSRRQSSTLVTTPGAICVQSAIKCDRELHTNTRRPCRGAREAAAARYPCRLPMLSPRNSARTDPDDPRGPTRRREPGEPGESGCHGCRASVSPATSSAPARTNARATSRSVLPSVKTSSMTSTRHPATAAGSGTRRARRSGPSAHARRAARPRGANAGVSRSFTINPALNSRLGPARRAATEAISPSWSQCRRAAGPVYAGMGTSTS
jgi:hypothetical protein